MFGKQSHSTHTCEIEAHCGIDRARHIENDQERWWLGFDCGHSGDVIPKHPEMAEHFACYRTIAYVERVTRDLARQLAAMTGVKTESSIHGS